MQLTDYIRVVDKLVPDELCDALLEEYASSDEWKSATVDGNDLNPSIRNCEMLRMSGEDSLAQNELVRKALDSALFECVGHALADYRDFQKIQIGSDSGYELLRYEAGGYYREHVDTSPNLPRTLACSIALNDGYEGGEFAFFNGTQEYRVPKGSAIMFPANFMFPHQIKEVTAGTRYSMITWFR